MDKNIKKVEPIETEVNDTKLQGVAVQQEVAVQPIIPMGFEDEDEDDLIIPRVKVVQALSPERKDKVADEGDIINSLTKAKLNGKKFIPVFKFNNNIKWIPRDSGGGIECSARDGKIGINADGKQLLCKVCRKNEFDNSKQGKDAQPTCNKYINFFGFFEGEKSPIILSFARTNYAEGKKLYSVAKVTMQNMFNYSYELFSKEVTKNGNTWFIADTKQLSETSQEDRDFATVLFQTFRTSLVDMKIDDDNAVGGANDTVEIIVDTASTEY